MSTLSPAQLDALIEDLTVDCYNDEEQLTGLLTGAEEALVVGEIATIAGAEIRIMAVDSPSDNTTRPDHRVRARRPPL